MRPHAQTCGPHSTLEGCDATIGGSWRVARSGRLDQLKLGQRGHAIVEANLLNDLAADYLQHRRAREVHLPAGRSRHAADQEVIEGRTCMGATTFPLTDDIVALGDKIRSAPEVEIGECGPEIGHERLDVVAATSGFMQRVFEQHVWRGDLVNDSEIDALAPEFGK